MILVSVIFQVKFISSQYIKAKQFHFKFSFRFRLLSKTRFSKKPDNQTESPKWVYKTGLANKSVPNLFLVSIKFFSD